MAWALGAVAGGLATAEMREGKRAGQQVVGKMETPHQFKLALAESRGLGTSRFDPHLSVLMP
jgi:hypothetical protein